MQKVSFRESRITSTDFIETNLLRSDFTSATMGGNNMKGAIVEGTICIDGKLNIKTNSDCLSSYKRGK
jgi:uncharacterized protein YjbI with pentapeptide repeats